MKFIYYIVDILLIIFIVILAYNFFIIKLRVFIIALFLYISNFNHFFFQLTT